MRWLLLLLLLPRPALACGSCLDDLLRAQHWLWGALGPVTLVLVVDFVAVRVVGPTPPEVPDRPPEDQARVWWRRRRRPRWFLAHGVLGLSVLVGSAALSIGVGMSSGRVLLAAMAAGLSLLTLGSAAAMLRGDRGRPEAAVLRLSVVATLALLAAVHARPAALPDDALIRIATSPPLLRRPPPEPTWAERELTRRGVELPPRPEP